MVFISGRVVNIGLSVLFCLIAILLILKSWKYLRNELRIAPRQRLRDRFWINFSILLFSVILTIVILFVAALISSTIISNRAFLGNSDLSPLPPLNPSFIEAFEFPLLLPATLIGLGVFIVIYPFGEMLYMGQKTSDGAMEIQKWFENRIVDRFRPPFSYLIAILSFFIIYLVPPTLIVMFFAYINAKVIAVYGIFAIILIYMDWFMLFPIMYLTYYSTIGSAQALFIGFKRNLVKAKKMRFIYLLIAFIAIITAILNLRNYIPYLINPEKLTVILRETYQDVILQEQYRTIIDTIALWLGKNPWNLPFLGPKASQFWLNLTAIVPFDLFIFFLSTMIFALIGFFSKFLSKEPLNRPILVLFAAYILCGIAFQIFGYVITKWPWAFPDQNAYFSLQNIVDLDDPEEAVLFARLFIPAVTFDKIFMVIFLFYQLFFNKNLRITVNELAISQAIADKDVKILLKYARNKNPQIRRLVLEAVSHICDTYPEDIEDFLPVIHDLAVDHDPEVIRAITPAIKIIGYRSEHLNLVPILQFAFGTEQDASISEMQKVLIELGRIDPAKVQAIYEHLYEGYIPDKAKDALVSVLNTLGDHFPELSYNIASPLLERKTTRIRQGAMQIIRNLIHHFKPKFRQLYNKMKEIADNMNDPIRGTAIEIMGYICSVNRDYIDEFLNDYKQFTNLTDENLKEIIGGLTQIAISHPDYVDRVYPEIINKFSDAHTSIQGDITMSLGVISMHTSLEFYLSKIHPQFIKIVEDQNLRKILLNTLRFLFKARSELFNIEQCRNLLSTFLLDKDVETRKDSVEIVNSIDFVYASNIYLETLRNTKKREDAMFLLSSMNDLLDTHYLPRDILDESLSRYFFKVLTATDVEDPGILPLVTKLLCNLSQFSTSLTEISFAFLDSVLQGNNDHATSYVLTYFGKIIVQLQLNPNKYAVKMNFRQFYEETLKFALNDQMPNSQIAAYYTLTLLYNNTPDLGMEIYDFCYGQRNDIGVENKSTIMKLITHIACDKPAIFFKEFYEENVRWLDPSRLELEIFPFIIKNLDTIDEIEEAVVYSLSLITTTYGTSNIIKEFLIQAIKKIKKSVSQKVNLINCLIQIPDIEWDTSTIRRIISFTDSKNALIRENSLKALAFIFNKLRPYDEYSTKSRLAYQRSINMLVNSMMQRKFIKDSNENVRIIFIRIARDMAINNPDFSVPMLFIRDLALDSSFIVSNMAIAAYFKYIQTYPEKLQTTASYLRLFANSTNVQIREGILNKIKEFDYTRIDLTYVLPTLLKLAADTDSDIRKKSLNIYQEIYRKTTEKLFYFVELLVKITRKKDPRIRIDSLNVISEIAFEFPEQVQKRNLIFDMYTQLSKDYDTVVKRTVSEKIENLIKIFPDQLNVILRMIYSLIREQDRTTFLNCTNALKYVLLLYPDQRKVIKDAIQRFYKRTAHPALEELEKEF